MQQVLVQIFHYLENAVIDKIARNTIRIQLWPSHFTHWHVFDYSALRNSKENVHILPYDSRISMVQVCQSYRSTQSFWRDIFSQTLADVILVLFLPL